MKTLTLLLAVVTLSVACQREARAAHGIVHADRAAAWYNANYSWHAPYAHVQYGRPVALIVPPNANFQTEYSWGVGRTMMRPLNYQFGRPVATPGAFGGWQPAPRWPSSTEQIGVYSVRGPW